MDILLYISLGVIGYAALVYVLDMIASVFDL